MPAEHLREHAWRLDQHRCWSPVRRDCVVALSDLIGDAPRSLYEPCLAGTLDGMDPVVFPTVEGAVRWIERHTAGELRARAGQEVSSRETQVDVPKNGSAARGGAPTLPGGPSLMIGGTRPC